LFGLADIRGTKLMNKFLFQIVVKLIVWDDRYTRKETRAYVECSSNEAATWPPRLGQMTRLRAGLEFTYVMLQPLIP
jgi:hypothetical protein